MANTLKGFRLPDITLEQLEWLIDHGHGSQSAVVVKALDRLYQAERARAAQPAAGEGGGVDNGKRTGNAQSNTT